MQKINFNKDWTFTFENNLDAYNNFGLAKYSEAQGAPGRFYENSTWQKVDLPHDWAIALPKDIHANTFAGARANTHYHRFNSEIRSNVDEIFNIGWYRKEFLFLKKWTGKRIFIEFEGIFRDAILWVNGVYIDRHQSGYTPFICEITDHLIENEKNSIAVRVDSDQPEGWFYEGAGIYRNVNLLIGECVYVKPYKTVVNATINGCVNVSTTIVNDTDNNINQTVTFSVSHIENNPISTCTKSISIPPFSEANLSIDMTVDSPLLWDIDHPNLYTLTIDATDRHTETFGFRSIFFDADKGFFLNGTPLKIRGACVHQDLGGVGTALSDNLNRYKIQKLKEMGVNAYRSSHHPPSPSILDACDELGMLVMDETRCFGTSPEAKRQLKSLIERDRNHPSVFMWCIGNEEFSVQDSEWSYRLTQKMTRIVLSLDDTRPVTYGGNNGSNFIGANGASQIRGINYIRNDKPHWVDNYHKEHPTQPIIGTEESSYVLSRNITENDLGSGKIDYTGDMTMPWGSTPKGWVKFYEERPWMSGGFMWTGFDYHGEPNPFVNTNVSSSFGTIDLCGIEKPPFWYYKAWWTDEPVLKIAPHWNFNNGEDVKVTVYTNLENVTLYLNNESLGTKSVEKYGVLTWIIQFKAGTLSVSGEKDGKVYTDEIKTAGTLHKIDISTHLFGENDRDISIVDLKATDVNGNLCVNSTDVLELSLKEGTIIGVCNGDPACLDYEQKPFEEDVRYIRNFAIADGMMSIPHKAPNDSFRRFDFIHTEPKTDGFEDEIRLVADYKGYINKEREYTLTTKISDVSTFEYIEIERFGGDAVVYLNGVEIGNNSTYGRQNLNITRPYRFYCDFKDGENEIKITVKTYEPMLKAISGYVKLGKIKNTPWEVRLFGGRARVFVKSKNPDSLTARIK